MSHLDAGHLSFAAIQGPLKIQLVLRVPFEHAHCLVECFQGLEGIYPHRPRHFGDRRIPRLRSLAAMRQAEHVRQFVAGPAAERHV